MHRSSICDLSHGKSEQKSVQKGGEPGEGLALGVPPWAGGARQLLQVTRVFTDRVVVGVVDHPQLSHNVPSDGGLDSPVVDVAVLLVTRQLLHVHDLGAEPVQDDANVLDGEVVFLVYRELVHQQEELATGCRLSLLALKTTERQMKESPATRPRHFIQFEQI